MDFNGLNRCKFFSQTQTDPSDRSDRSDKSDKSDFHPQLVLPLREGLGGYYFKIILISAVTSLTLISPSPLMSHTASE